MKGLNNADISIMKLDIFSDKSHSDLLLRMLPGIDHGLPFGQIRLRAVQLQALTGNLGQMLLFHSEGRFI